MSVLVDSNHGFVISHEKALEEVYAVESSRDENCKKKLQFKHELFNILTPYKMDSQIKASLSANTEVANGDSVVAKQPKKKRKRKQPLNEGEIAALQFHEENKDILQRALTTLVDLAKDKHFFLSAIPQDKGDNNKQSRTAASIVGPKLSLIHLCIERQNSSKSDDVIVRVIEDGSTLCDSPVGVVWHYLGETVAVVNIMSEEYVLPPRSTFLLSDLKQLPNKCHELGSYNLIVIDPPWQNKSAKRQKTYWRMKNDDLLDLPVPVLADEDCLIVVWATNKQAQHGFIHDTLFPAWNVKFLAHWFWLKVTKTGETVLDMKSPQKKPYESVIIGHLCKGKDICHHTDIPDKKVVISVPCGLHSKKPPLYEVLKTYLHPDPRCLELFARNLWPGWTSWGNEVLLHQHIDFFEPVT